MSNSTDTIHQSMLDNMDDKYQKTIGFPTYDILRAVAIALKAQNDDIEIAKNMYDVDTLTGETLQRFVEQRKGIVWNKAVKAEAILTATTNGAATVPIGTLFESQGGIQFKADETVVIEGLTGSIPVTAVLGGAEGNVAANTITIIPVTIDGLTSVTNAEASSGGYRAETDDELRERYYKALQEPVVSGNKNHYKQWALSIDGVGAVKVFPLANGNNTVEVCIIGNDGKPAASSLIESAQEYLDPEIAGLGEGVAPIGAYCTVTTATAVLLNIVCHIELISGYTLEEVESRIEDNLTAYLAEQAFKVDYISYAHIADVIHDTEGVSDYDNLLVNGATSAIELEAREVAVLGEVALNE